MNTTTKEKPFLLANAHEFVGAKVAVTGWVDIDQVQVNVFGEVSRWRKPGHCDPESARNGHYDGTLLTAFTWSRSCHTSRRMRVCDLTMATTR